PLAADLDGDGREEILITRSDALGGAAHLVLALRGGRLALKARGEAVGMGNRWSHLLGAFDMDGAGRKVLAIETPHLGGRLLALRLDGGRLRERARRSGFTTHAIGSRNMWQFSVMRRGGVAEIVLQERGRGRLAALSLFGKRWTLRWTFPLAAPARSNFLAGDFNGDGKDDLAFSDESGTVHLLLSRAP
ncbi:MAG: FG-GAP repeat protein, partial [bacterium]